MAEVTLADYAGYIFLEIIKAREMADHYSRQVAETYAKDPVLQFFSVPRFKVPKMELTIPVLISGARFNQLIRFNMRRRKFIAYVLGRVQYVVGSVRMKNSEAFLPRGTVEAVFDSKIKAANTPSIAQLASDFWQYLHDNPDPSQPGNIVQQMWVRIFEQALIEQNLVEAYKKNNPNNELLKQTLDEVLKTVTTNTVVDSTTIQSLLVNPETNIVKTGSSDTSVFTIKAEMMEEGFFIREVKDEKTGQTRPVVEFE